MSNQNNLKISHPFSLPDLNFKTQMNISIDANAHIKNILNVECFLFDTAIETLSGKCSVKGKVGVRILYLDVDNMYNVLTDETSFNEMVNDTNLTSDCKVCIYNEQISNEIDYDERLLKITLNIHSKLYCNVDTQLNSQALINDNYIIKSKTIKTNTCIDKIDNKISEDCTILIPNKINKVLSLKISSFIEKIECNSGYIAIEGYNNIQTIYEAENQNFNEIKLYTENKPFKIEIQATLTDPECIANIVVKNNNFKNSFSTELQDNQTNLKIDYEMQICGFSYKNINLELIEDAYSISNEIETNFTERELCEVCPYIYYKGNIDGDINLQDASADEILESVNYSCLITQTYFEKEKLIIEGIINSTLIYLNEQKEIKSMQVELPFSLAKEFNSPEYHRPINFDIKVLTCKAKIKRGNSISLDYEIIIEGYFANYITSKFIDSIKLGKSFDYGDIAFQLVLAKPNEDIWNFCKRAHTSLQKLEEYNKDLPPIFSGGEKVIIYR